MMKKKIPVFLTKQIRPLRIYYFMIVIFFIGTLLFFYFRTIALDGFISDLSTTKTEWSLSEHSGFLSRLIAEFNKTLEDEANERKREQEIRSILMAIQGEIDKIKVTTGVEEQKPGPANIDELAEYVKVHRTLEDHWLKDLSWQDLGLTFIEKTPEAWKNVEIEKGIKPNIQFYILQSLDKPGKNRSFVFIPTQLFEMDENNQPYLSLRLKRELVFSKIVEEYLLEALKKIPGANQSYFIPVSGFVRICSKQSDNAVKEYRDKFEIKQNFADRSYFNLTIRKTFHRTPLYVDSGGQGILRTYSIAVLNQKFEIVGIIGVDVEISNIKSALSQITPGVIGQWFKNYSLDFCGPGEIESKQFQTERGLLKDDDKAAVYDFKDKRAKTTPNIMNTQVNRFDFDSKGNWIETDSPVFDPADTGKIKRIIYSVPISEKKIAFFIFDKQRLMWNNIYFALILGILLVIVTILIKFVYNQMQKRMQEEEKKLELITHMHSSYVITDKSNNILVCNEEFENLVGDKNITGKNFEEYLSSDSIKDFKFFMNTGKERFECPVVIKTKPGNEKSAILINSSTAYFLDKKARISILIRSENIEAAVAEKYADRIAHVLKSPLHSILQIADQLRRKSAQPRFDDYFKLLDVEISGLKGEISRLLNMLKTEIKSPKPEYKKFDLSRLVKDIKEEYVPLVNKKKLEFDCNFSEGVTMVGDRNMIKVAIENILDNALKYTPNGRLSFYLSETRENVNIIIADTGIGIPGDDLNLIFEKSYRGKHQVVQEAPGKGLGLYHCNNLIELHGGKIDVKSEVGKGSEFTILVPRNLEETINQR